MRNSLSVLGGLVVVSLVLTAPSALAQQQFTRIKVSGKITGMRGQTIAVRSKQGQDFAISINSKRPVPGPNNTYFQLEPLDLMVQSTEDAKFLRAGMYIKFQGHVTNNRNMTIEAPVKKMTIFTPQQGTSFGMFPDNVGGPAPEAAIGGPAGGVGEQAAPKIPGDFLICGQIAAVRNGMMSIRWPGGGIQAKIDPVAVVKVGIADIRLAKLGDDIQVEGVTFQAPNVLATKVLITRGGQAPANGGVAVIPGNPAEKPGGVDPGGVDPPAGNPDAGGGVLNPVANSTDTTEPGAEPNEDGVIPGRILRIN